MGTETLNSYTATGIVLTSSGAYNSPFTVTASGTIATADHYAVYSDLSMPFLLNEGCISDAFSDGADANGVLLNDGGTLTNAGAYAVISGDNDGLKAQHAAGYVTNYGTVTGGFGDGVDLGDGGTITNSGLIATGVGFYAKYYRATGGAGVYLNSGTLSNTGGIAGGPGGFWGFSGGAAGGVGVDLNTGTLNNAGSISGGYGGYAHYDGGTGGAGVALNSGTLSNTGSIAGGHGGGAYQGTGTGGAGASITSGAVYTAGIISGGAGGSGTRYGGAGGVGVDLNTGTLTNTGSITGGTGAYTPTYSGRGGSGIIVSGDAFVYNSGSITGGTGDYTRGDGAVLGGDSTLVNTGMISGGIGVFASSAGDVTNSGTITGDLKDGVYLEAGGTVTNSGLITGAAAPNALYYTGAGAGAALDTGTLRNSGSIIGGAGGYANFFVCTGGTGGAGVDLNSGTLSNTGGITGGITGGAGGAGYFYGGAGGAGVDLNSGTLSNTGSITGGAGGAGGHGYGAGGAGINVSDAYVYNSGGITGGSGSAQGDGAVLGINSTLVNTGMISGGIGVFASSADDVTNSGTITGGTDAIYFGNPGGNTLIVDPGAVFNGAVIASSGINILEVAGASSIALTGIGTEFTGFTQLSFASGAAWTLEGDSLNGDTIVGFTKADALDVGNLIYYGPQFLTAAAGGVLSVTEGAGSDSFTFSGDAGYTYTITSDGNTGTEIEEVTCFAAGTRIATARGEVAVEELEIGELVQTVHASMQRIKWIGTRSYAAPFANHKKVLPVRICAGAIADGIPSRDLFVSPGHAICIDDALIHAARLVNGRTITQLERVESVAYYHVELENHEVILAENCPAETYLGEYFRKQFHNAESFSARYPGSQAPEVSCLPMLTHGFQLAAILRRLRARAGLTAASTPGRLSGYVDVCSATMVSGWAADQAAPDEPVRLDILDGETLIGRVIANIPRADVAAAGFGAGNHGFEFALPPGTTGPITVRRTADQSPLPHAIPLACAA